MVIQFFSLIFKEMKAVQPNGPYRIVGYSYGACVALEMAFQLQKEHPNNPKIVDPLIMLDGSHHYVRLYRKATHHYYNVQSEDLTNDQFETEILVNLLLNFTPLDFKTTCEKFLLMHSIDECINNTADTIFASGHVKDRQVLRNGIESYWNKMIMGHKYIIIIKKQN